MYYFFFLLLSDVNQHQIPKARTYSMNSWNTLAKNSMLIECYKVET